MLLSRMIFRETEYTERRGEGKGGSETEERMGPGAIFAAGMIDFPGNLCHNLRTNPKY
jgi:hypothetical protein